MISTFWPCSTRPASRPCNAVTADTGTTAACSKERFTGLRASLFSRTTAYSANAPFPKPNTSSPAVTRFSAGDEVFGFGKGAFAEYAVVRENKLARKPVNLSFEQAAVVPVSAVTALQGLDAGRVEQGQKVLIIGASGGVGSYAVQLAKAFGAQVTGVCSTAKLDLVRSLGADHVIDYTRDDFADGAHRYD